MTFGSDGVLQSASKAMSSSKTQDATPGESDRTGGLAGGHAAIQDRNPDLTRGIRRVIRPLLVATASARANFLERASAEHVHAYRAALRRIRAAFDLFLPALPSGDGAWIVRQLRWQIRRLGPTRDLDVLLERLAGTHRYTQRACDHDLLVLAATEARLAAVCLAAADAVSARAVTFTAGLDPYLAKVRAADGDTSLIGFASAVLSREDAAIRAVGRNCDKLGPRARHRLRKGIKAQRYNTESLAWLFGAEEEYGRRLTDLHRVLGDMNDATVCARLAEGLGGRRGTVEVARALKPQLRQAWSQFEAVTPSWTVSQPRSAAGRVAGTLHPQAGPPTHAAT
jgi:CHAD domain-containing protein